MTLLTGAITLLGLLALCWSMGNLAPRFRQQEDLGVWTGLLVLLGLASLVQFGFPIGSPAARAIVCVVGLVGLVRSWRSTDALAGLRNSLSVRTFGAMMLLVVAMTALSLRAVTNADSGLYHFQAIEFLRSERIIIGWSNLHIRLAHPSSAYQIAAVAENGLWGSDGYRLTAALLLVLTALTFAGALRRLRDASGRTSDAVLVVALPCVWGMLLFQTAFLSGVSLDGTTALVGVVAAGRVLHFLEQRDAPSLFDAAVAAAIAYSLRPIHAWLILVLVLAFFRFRRRSQISLGPIALPAAFIGLFTARTWLLSGVPGFPVGPATPWTPWALSSEEVTWYRAEVSDLARGSAERLWTSLSRLAGWFEGLSTLLGEFAVTGLLSSALAVLLRNEWRPWRELMVPASAVLVAPVLIWFLFGPDFRFGMGPLAALSALPVALLQIGGEHATFRPMSHALVRWTAIVLVLLLVVAPALGARRSDLLGSISSPSSEPTGERPPVVEVARSGDISISAPLGDSSFCGREVWCVPNAGRAERIEVRRFLLWHVVTQHAN